MSSLLRLVAADLAAALLLACVGVWLAWWLRRATTLSIRNVHPPAIALTVLAIIALAGHRWTLAAILIPASAPFIAAAAVGRRWRLADLGAGEELRRYELSRRWIWQADLQRRKGEHVRLKGQGEIVRQRAWPAELPYVPMTRRGDRGPRLPLDE